MYCTVNARWSCIEQGIIFVKYVQKFTRYMKNNSHQNHNYKFAYFVTSDREGRKVSFYQYLRTFNKSNPISFKIPKQHPLNPFYLLACFWQIWLHWSYPVFFWFVSNDSSDLTSCLLSIAHTNCDIIDIIVGISSTIHPSMFKYVRYNF